MSAFATRHAVHYPRADTSRCRESLNFLIPSTRGLVQPKTAYAASPLIFHASVAYEDHISISKCIPGVAPQVCKNRALSGAPTGYLFLHCRYRCFYFTFRRGREQLEFFSPFYFCIDDNKLRIYKPHMILFLFFLLTTGCSSSNRDILREDLIDELIAIVAWHDKFFSVVQSNGADRRCLMIEEIARLLVKNFKRVSQEDSLQSNEHFK